MKTNHTEFAPNRQKSAHRWIQLSLVSLFVVLVAAGCNPEQNAAVTSNPVGSYVLVSVDGNKVPCTLQHEGHSVAIQSGTFIIAADSTCSSTILLAGQNTAVAVNATYTREGSKLTMHWAGAGTTVGTVKGDTFTMTNEGMILTYHKQQNSSS